MIRASTTPVFKGLAKFIELALSPFATGPALLALVLSSSSTGEALFRHFSIKQPQRLASPELVLQVAFALGCLQSINRLISSASINGGRVRASSLWDWPKEIAVITGGCSGIGHCTVKRLIKRRIKVAILDIQGLPEDLKNHPLVRLYECDITSPEAVAKAAESIVRDIGQPTILINNAGIMNAAYPILSIPQAKLQKIFEINVLSQWTTVQQFVPDMIAKNKGHIITIASIASYVNMASVTDYSATKAATLSFHEGLRTELKCIHKVDQVLTSSVHPSFVRTPFMDEVVDKIDEERIECLTPEQVADQVVALLFSRKSGQAIVPNNVAAISSLRGWPTWLQERLRDEFGYAVASLHR